MAQDTILTPLNFNADTISKTLNDKKTGLDITLGHVSGMPPAETAMAAKHNNIAIALMDSGIGQAELDQACQSLAEECLTQDFDILITKSDLPFDARWYLIGDLSTALNAAGTDRISLPFSEFMYDELQEIISHFSE